MTAIGESLRLAREERGLSLERVSEETNIAKRYLTALEAEDYAVFPGDPYAIGFLRNYAEYLGLESDDLVSSFRNMRIQEQPVPIQDLIPARKKPIGLVVLISALVFGLGIGGYFLFFKGPQQKADAEAAAERKPMEYRLEGASFEKRLYLGDSILWTDGTAAQRFLIARIDEALNLETPYGTRRLSLGEESSLDIDKDGDTDLKFLVADLDKKDSGKGVLVRIEAPGAAQAAASAPTSSPAPSPAPAPAPPEAVEQSPPSAARNNSLFEATKSPHPFVMTVTFRGPSMFRYEVDRKDRDERYYHKGETITINANNGIKLWTSNAQSAKVVVQASGGKSADLDLGGAGEVAVKRVAWTQGEGGFTLTVFDVD